MTYFDDFDRAWRYISKNGDADKALSEIIAARAVPDHAHEFMSKQGFVYVSDDLDIEPLRRLEHFHDLALERKRKDPLNPGVTVGDGSFLLGGRYVFPVRSPGGRILALIGWYPDVKRYITTPSRYFSKTHLFYGMEQFAAQPKESFLVEGIFDSLSLRALGLSAFATMGVTVDSPKRAMYPLLGNFLAIPDRDKTGKRVIRRNDWKMPTSGRYLRITQNDQDLEEIYRVKDIDDVCKLYDPADIRSELETALKSRRKIVPLAL